MRPLRVSPLYSTLKASALLTLWFHDPRCRRRVRCLAANLGGSGQTGSRSRAKKMLSALPSIGSMLLSAWLSCHRCWLLQSELVLGCRFRAQGDARACLDLRSDLVRQAGRRVLSSSSVLTSCCAVRGPKAQAALQRLAVNDLSGPAGTVVYTQARRDQFCSVKLTNICA